MVASSYIGNYRLSNSIIMMLACLAPCRYSMQNLNHFEPNGYRIIDVVIVFQFFSDTINFTYSKYTYYKA